MSSVCCLTRTPPHTPITQPRIAPAEVNLVIRLVRSIAACMAAAPAGEAEDARIEAEAAGQSGAAE